jgi:outer membrane protein OmpA-like peptidoglycan-associated protein
MMPGDCLSVRGLLLLLGLLLTLRPCAISQPSGAIPEKALKIYTKALSFQENDPARAEALLREATGIAPGYRDAWAKLGDVLVGRGDLAGALESYEKALEIDPVSRQLIWFSAAAAAMHLGRYADAAEKLQAFLALQPKNERQRASAEQLLRRALFSAEAVRNPVPFSPERLGPAVNTLVPEYLPSLSADGQTLVFTRVVDNQEDFFAAYRESPTAPWQPAQPLTSLNTPLNEGAHCLSADGTTLVFTACNRPGGKGSCDLYSSVLEYGQWTAPQNLGVPINSEGYETQPSVSADGRILIFTARRPNGFGNNDLWQSEKDENGQWGKPRNLGPAINTPEDDQAPFLHPDGQTLYFMSKGHPGMGGFDLYVARKNAQGDWDPPKNLGFPINSSRNEGALIVSADGKTAYFARDQEEKSQSGIPLTDIWTFALYPDARPTPVTYARGRVLDADTRQPLQAAVQVTALGSAGPASRLLTLADGSFLVCLPIGADYAFSVQHPGYLFFSDFFGLREVREASDPYLLEIPLQPIPQPVDTLPTATAPVVLRNIFFASGSAAIQPASFPELERLLKLLQDNPRMHIQINGHTDDVGTAADNLLLSERRAEAVFRFLVENGVSSQRLQYAGFGESRPLVPNDTPENRDRNRRTEFVVLSN